MIVFNTDSLNGVVRNLGRASDRVLRRCASAMSGLGLSIMESAIVDEPRIPVKTQSLRASGSVFLGDRFIRSSESIAFGRWSSEPYDPTPLRNSPLDRNTPSMIQSVIVFNKSYAAKWETGWPDSGRFSDPTAGPRALDTALYVEGREQMLAVIQSAVNRELGA